MCLSPNHVWVSKGPVNEKIPVPCKQCWQCRSNRVNDWVGRCLAEAAYSDWTMTLTLTYRHRDDGHEKIIYPPHFQYFIKALRKRGHSVRYLGVGEYGSLKGRAHFHCILFGKGEKPKISKPKKGATSQTWPHGVNFNDRTWPHGHMFADHKADEKSIRYVVKYLLKNQKDAGQLYWLTMSKKPPLGAAFFAAKAQQLVDHDLLPTGYHYRPPGAEEGKKRQFFMNGATRRDYLLAILRGLREKLSKRLGPMTFNRSGAPAVSEFVEPGLYKVQRDQRLADAERWAKENVSELWERLRIAADPKQFDSAEDIEDAIYWLHKRDQMVKDIQEGVRDQHGYRT